MNRLPLIALGLHGWLGLHLGNAMVITEDHISSMVAYMEKNPTAAQIMDGCNKVGDALNRFQFDQSAEGFMLKKMGEAVVDNVDDPGVFLTCTSKIVNHIVFNFERTKLLHDLCPDLTKALIKGLKKYSNQPEILSRTLEHIAGLHSGAASQLYTAEISQLGGFDILHDAVEKWPSDGAVQMSAWRGFSDHSHTELGASIIANWGGPLKGIDWLLQKLRAHPEPHFGIGGDTLDSHYEILQVVNGLLDVDKSNIYGPALLNAGLVDLVGHAMRVDSDLRGTQEVSCEVFQKLFVHNPGLKPTLAQGPQPIVDLIVGAIQQFHDNDPTPWGANTFGQAYPVIPLCANVLEQIAIEGTGMQAILKTPISEVLRSVRPDMQYSVQNLAKLVASH